MPPIPDDRLNAAALRQELAQRPPDLPVCVNWDEECGVVGWVAKVLFAPPGDCRLLTSGLKEESLTVAQLRAALAEVPPEAAVSVDYDDDGRLRTWPVEVTRASDDECFVFCLPLRRDWYDWPELQDLWPDPTEFLLGPAHPDERRLVEQRLAEEED
jgi:hypothetical protein